MNEITKAPLAQVRGGLPHKACATATEHTTDKAAGGAQIAPGTKVGPKQVKKLQAPSGNVWLQGPRRPYWDCSRCGAEGIYACRLYCNVCNHRAPVAVRQVAQQQSVSPDRAGGKGGGGEGGGHRTLPPS